MKEINFEKMPSAYWSDSTKISYLQRRVIVYSIMYYELNESVISDTEYDKISKQLVNMQNEAGGILKETQYYYCMHDFDGSTGFDLFHRLTKSDREYLLNMAKFILKMKKGKDKVKWEK